MGSRDTGRHIDTNPVSVSAWAIYYRPGLRRITSELLTMQK